MSSPPRHHASASRFLLSSTLYGRVPRQNDASRGPSLVRISPVGYLLTTPKWLATHNHRPSFFIHVSVNRPLCANGFPFCVPFSRVAPVTTTVLPCWCSFIPSDISCVNLIAISLIESRNWLLFDNVPS